ncbi:MAG TPA: histidine phosphatase family protein, partial [Pseudonocardia sp.]|nr:histidine phosphatase family protein [Pseudonocardia sp.]
FGHRQAGELATRLAEWSVTAVHASRAIRAQQTARPVAARHALEVEIAEGVHEVFCGDLEGRSDPEARMAFDEVYHAWGRGDLDARLPGGESARDVRERYVPAVEALTRSAHGDVVLVSHGAAIRLGAAALLGDTAETQYVPNTGVVVLRRDGRRWELEHWDPAPPAPGDVTAGGTAI